jgi:hypothetical protein
VFDASDLSAEVEADPAQAIFVPPTSDTSGGSGAWKRRFSGAKDARWFGAVADGVTDNAVPLQRWLDHGGPLTLSEGEYYSADSLIVRNQVNIDGAGYGFDARTAGGYAAMPGTKIRFAEGKGMIVYGQTTHDDTSDVNGNPGLYFTQEGGRYSSFRNIALIGANAGAEVAGFESRTRVFLENIHCIEFTGVGFDIQGSADIDDVSSDYGNPSLSTLRACRADGNGSHGFHIRGRDASVVGLYDCDSVNNGGWGIWDQSLVGGHYANCHIATNTLGSVKCLNVIGNVAFLNCYVEGAVRSNCDISGSHCIVGGTLGGVTNDATGGTGNLPAYVGGLLSKFGAIKFHGERVDVPGALTDSCHLFRHVTHGLWLQGHGATFDMTIRNRNNQDVLQIPGATQNLVAAGTLQATGFLVAGTQVVGARGAAVADATDAATVITQLNALLARLRTHGLIAT